MPFWLGPAAGLAEIRRFCQLNRPGGPAADRAVLDRKTTEIPAIHIYRLREGQQPGHNEVWLEELGRSLTRRHSWSGVRGWLMVACDQPRPLAKAVLKVALELEQDRGLVASGGRPAALADNAAG